jgi:hypothetical protein
MNKKLLRCVLFIIFLSYPADTYCDNAKDLDIAKDDIAYCKIIIDGYTSILWSYENRYCDKTTISINVINYMNDINRKIIYYKQKCNIGFEDERHDILLTKT